MEIGDTSKEAVNINENTTESVEETEPPENAENAEKLGDTIVVSEIFFLHFGRGESTVSATEQNLLKRG